MSSYFVTPHDLYRTFGTAAAPLVVDTCRADYRAGADRLLPAAIWRDFARVEDWMATLPAGRPVVISCAQGKKLSQSVAARLRVAGRDARVLEGGVEAWAAAGLPMIDRAAADGFLARKPSFWVTRRRPKIDRVACPWLIRRFLDPDAVILFVDPPEVANVAHETGAIPFDIEGVDLSHEGERCSFDTLLDRLGLEGDPALDRLARIVRGADTASFDLEPEAAGLLAISLGISAQAGEDDEAMLRHGFVVYDGLYAWARFSAGETHNWPATKRAGR